MKNLGAVLVIMITILSIFPVAAGASGQGQTATPYNDGPHPWSTNGCTAVPDAIWGVMNFNHSCDHHDGCYGAHWQSRYGCDVTFYYDMNSTCNSMWSWWNPARSLCRGTRNLYYTGVRALGYPAYAGWSISALLG